MATATTSRRLRLRVRSNVTQDRATRRPSDAAALRERYQALINETLPSTYTQPIRFNHCFGRVVLDWLFDDVWYDHVERPAYKNLTADQLAACIGRMEAWLADHNLLVADNDASLRVRGKR